jgi:LCP family protein required for cell wall assembly
MGPENEGNRQEPPDYKVYRARRRFGAPDLDSLRQKLRRDRPEKAPKEPAGPEEAKPEREGRPWLKWIGFALLGWLLLSIVAFAVSATIQKSKLTDMGDTLDSNPLMALFAQNILVLGTDVRDTEFASAEQAESEECVEAAETGEATLDCASGARADTIMVLRAGGGAFEKLSIPRDTLAAIPGFGNDKINAAYRFGGAPLMVETVEQLLGIELNHVAIVDFAGFRDLIDSLGGVDITLEKPVCNEISGGTFKIDFDAGEINLNGEKALALARTRSSTCSTINDLDRTQFQQQIIQGMKDRLTDPLRIPINFLKGPLIGWNAPKAFVSDMGALAMPQFVFAAAIGGSSDTEVLEPADVGANPLIVPVENCIEAVRKLTGDPPENDPVCSPTG